MTFPVGSIPSRVVARSIYNLFTIYNCRSSQIINTIALSPECKKNFYSNNFKKDCFFRELLLMIFVYDSAGEILYILTSKTGKD